jgi:hypothetical protein
VTTALARQGGELASEPGKGPFNCSRRGFMRAALLALGSMWIPRGHVHGAAPPGGSSPHGAVGHLVGEVLQYRARCPLVAEVASGEIRFRKIGGTEQYLATLETRLQGVLGLVTLQRVDLFASLMEWSERYGRLLPLWHADQVSTKGSWRRKVLTFDSDRAGYVEHRLHPDPKRGGVRRWKSAGRILDDPLSAFYNWRIGAFGALGEGRSYVVDNLARKEPLSLRFHTSPEEESRRLRAMEPEPVGKVYHLTAHLDVELHEAFSGDIEAWLDGDWVPVEGRANRVRLVGEATAYLVRKARISEPELPAAPPPPLSRELWRIT